MSWTKKEIKQIDNIAYFKWIDAGQPDNMSSVFWQAAEKEFSENQIIEVNLPYRKKPRCGRYDFLIAWGTEFYA